jgi:DNA polymerase-3 subunit beta
MTTNCTLNVSRSHMAALLNLSSNRDVRYYLNGVHVIARENETRYEATDGHVVGVSRHPSVNGTGGQEVLSLIVPRDLVKRIAGHKASGEYVNLCCTAGVWGVALAGEPTPFTPIDGRFPDVARVFPQAPSGEVAQFNPDFFKRFAKVRDAFGSKHHHPHIVHNGNGPARVTLPGLSVHFVGAMMPYVTKAPIPASDWV